MTDNGVALVERVGNLAYENERKYSGCAQAVLGAFREVLGDDVVSEAVFKSGTGLCGGCANTFNVCGAVSAGVMVLSLYSGRDSKTWAETDKMFRSFELGQRLTSDFKERFWSIDCRGIQEKLMGRSFNTNFQDGRDAFEAAAGHTQHCPVVTRAAAEKVMEILIEEGYVAG